MNGRVQGLKENYKKRNVNNSYYYQENLRNEMSNILNLIKRLNLKRFFCQYEFEKENISKKIDALELKLEKISRILLKQKDSNLTNALINKKKNEIKELEFLIRKNKLPKSEIFTLLNKKMDLTVFLKRNNSFNNSNNNSKKKYFQLNNQQYNQYYYPNGNYDYYGNYDGYYDNYDNVQSQYRNCDYQQQCNEPQNYCPKTLDTNQQYENVNVIDSKDYNQFPVCYDPEYFSYASLNCSQCAYDNFPLYYPLQKYEWNNDLNKQSYTEPTVYYSQKKNISNPNLENNQYSDYELLDDSLTENSITSNSYDVLQQANQEYITASETQADDSTYSQECLDCSNQQVVDVTKESTNNCNVSSELVEEILLPEDQPNNMSTTLPNESYNECSNVNNSFEPYPEDTIVKIPVETTVKIPVEVVITEKEIIKVPIEIVKDSYDMCCESNNLNDEVQHLQGSNVQFQDYNLGQQLPTDNEKEIIKIPVEVVKDGYEVYSEFDNLYDSQPITQDDVIQTSNTDEKIYSNTNVKEVIKKVPIEIIRDGYELKSEFDNSYEKTNQLYQQPESLFYNEPEITESKYKNINLDDNKQQEYISPISIHIPDKETKGIAKIQPYINVTDYENLLVKQSEICEEYDNLLEKELENKFLEIPEIYENQFVETSINQDIDENQEKENFDNNIDTNSQFDQSTNYPEYQYNEYDNYDNNYQQQYPMYEDGVNVNQVNEFASEPNYQDISNFDSNENYYQDQYDSQYSNNVYNYDSSQNISYEDNYINQPINEHLEEESTPETKPQQIKAVPLATDDDDWFADDDEFDDLFE